jgi:hypothetical protein
MKLRMFIVGFLLLLVSITTALAYDIRETIPVSLVTVSNCMYNPMGNYAPPCNSSSPQYQPYTTWYNATIVYVSTQKSFPVRSAPVIYDEWKIYASNKSLVYTGEIHNYTIDNTTVTEMLSNTYVPCGSGSCWRLYLGTPVPTVVAIAGFLNFRNILTADERR